MTQPAGGFINGNTEAMLNFSVTGPNPGILGKQPSFTMGGLPEGEAFIKEDALATARLKQFIADANEGFQRYTTVARLSGDAYLSADEAGTAAIRSVSAEYGG